MISNFQVSYAIHEAISVALLSALDKDSYLMCIYGAISHLFFNFSTDELQK